MSLKIAVLYGGLSAEREVSLNSGAAMSRALKAKGYDHVTLIDVDRQVAQKLAELKPDVAVIGLHGKYGEDGCIQGILEYLDIPYTGPGVMASSVAMNKIMTKKILAAENIPSPKFTYVYKEQGDAQTLAASILQKLKPPMVLKAARQGSSIGIQFAFNETEVLKGVQECLQYDSEILAEEYIKGRELTVSILGNHDPIALPALEIVSESDFYDYNAKYTAGASRHYPVALSVEKDKEIKELALQTYKAIGCVGLSRVDFILGPDDALWVLEINTSPGFTDTSLFPDAARSFGIEFPDLMDRLIQLALERQ